MNLSSPIAPQHTVIGWFSFTVVGKTDCEPRMILGVEVRLDLHDLLRRIDSEEIQLRE